MQQPAKELLNTQLNADQESIDNKDSSNKKLIERERVENTPFWLITTEQGSWIAMGGYRITEVKGREEVLEEVGYISWDMIVRIAAIVAQDTLQRHIAGEPGEEDKKGSA